MTKWQERWFGLAEKVASWSEDDSTKVGAVTVLGKDFKTLGFNGLPRDVDMEVPERPEKYLYMEHAERNAIYNATRNGISLYGATMYVTHFPCSDCARAIIQAGIKEVAYLKKIETDQWTASNNASEDMFRRAGVNVYRVLSGQRTKTDSLQEPEHRNHEEQCRTERLLAISEVL